GRAVERKQLFSCSDHVVVFRGFAEINHPGPQQGLLFFAHGRDIGREGFVFLLLLGTQIGQSLLDLRIQQGARKNLSFLNFFENQGNPVGSIRQRFDDFHLQGGRRVGNRSKQLGYLLSGKFAQDSCNLFSQFQIGRVALEQVP